MIFGETVLCVVDAWGCPTCKKWRDDFLDWLEARAAAQLWEKNEKSKGHL